jgi:phosphate starvation-inducible protein PhoH
LASKRARNKKKLSLQNYDYYQEEYEKPRLVSVHPIKSYNFKLKSITPLTSSQKLTFEAYNNGHHLMLHGTAGTGKTYLALYLTLNELLNNKKQQEKIYIVRSVVPTRDIGFLPGDQKEKTRVYEAPYQAICNELFGRGDAYDILKQKNVIEFITTSFVRGITLNNCYILVDEFSNCNFHELDSIITRIGRNCRVIFCGDFRQSDLTRDQERNGVIKFMEIVKHLSGMYYVEFRREDIVRSKFVSDYIIEKERFETGAC